MSLTLGILETGYIPPPLDAKYGRYPLMFKALFHQQDETVRFKFYNVMEAQYPADVDECDAYLITGSKSNSYDEDPWIVTLKDYINTLYQHQKKMIGICFGHQIIAHALGGRAAKSEKGWGVGLYTSELAPSLDLPWLNGDVKRFNLLVSHQDQVMKLPDNATLLATNTFCPNSAYFIGAQILCFQGHPEFTPEFAWELMESRKDIIDEQTYNKGVESFKHQADHPQVVRWILDFIAD